MDQKAMYQITYGLYVLSAREGEKDGGCIVNTVQQVTSSPNRICVVVNKQNHTHDMIANSGTFNAAVLAQSAPFSLFQNFGFQSGRDADKFSALSYARTENGIAYPTEHVTAVLSGAVCSAVDLGTHTLFVADVTDGLILSSETPVTYGYYQSHIKPAPAATASAGWRCKICGYVHPYETLPEDFVCPICKHGASDFEKI